MNVYQQFRALHRLLRYRWRTERAELQFVRQRRQSAGGSVLDVGAHRGVYSYWMHRWFCHGTRVVAFEPQPELVEYLLDFRSTFRLDRLVIVPAGLSSRTGTLRMHRPPHHWGAASLEPVGAAAEDTDILDVPVVALDEYLADHPELRPVHILKCDVEYHEADVLAGAEGTLRADRPPMIVEWTTAQQARRESLFQLMQHVDYLIFQIEFGRLVPCTTATRRCPPSRCLAANYVMLPREVAEAA